MEIAKEDRPIGVVTSKLYWDYFRSGAHPLMIIGMVGLSLITQDLSTTVQAFCSVQCLYGFFGQGLHVLTSCEQNGTAACLSSPDANKCSRAQDCNAGNGSYECCSGSCVQGSSCLGENCEINRDCSTAEICCDTKCVDSLDCKGQTCSFENDCQTDEVCCYGSCREKVLCSDYTLIILICPVAIIAFVSISSCVFRRICFKTSISMKRYPFSHGFSSESTSSRSLISLPRPLRRTHLFYTTPRRVNFPEDFKHKVAKICEGPKPGKTTQYGSFREIF
ncbi:uncharacterized protein LOC111333518 [Stylophora pistillata]|uniref:uncharacterized protein LOC111333518 n=1 Tax=Stylophora pistillata TaxID=50429 RepID=UPI000C053575|nr:uncharacterized protein LOC111333518 [Stylophora pistillata]